MCNQLLLQFSMDHFETLHTCCGHIEDVHVAFLMELELIFTELQPFELSHLSVQFDIFKLAKNRIEEFVLLCLIYIL